VKRLLLDLEREHAGVKNSMIQALRNVVPSHLLDKRLNPGPALRQASLAKLVTLGRAGPMFP